MCFTYYKQDGIKTFEISLQAAQQCAVKWMGRTIVLPAAMLILFLNANSVETSVTLHWNMGQTVSGNKMQHFIAKYGTKLYFKGRFGTTGPDVLPDHTDPFRSSAHLTITDKMLFTSLHFLFLFTFWWWKPLIGKLFWPCLGIVSPPTHSVDSGIFRNRTPMFCLPGAVPNRPFGGVFTAAICCCCASLCRGKSSDCRLVFSPPAPLFRKEEEK